MSNLINDYVFDPENPEVNFKLAVKYKEIGQTGSAVSFFLRAGEKTNDTNLSYECLLHIGECFDIQQNRSTHVRGCYKHAISLIPRRPEAYFKLANFQNWNGQHDDAYFLTKTALEVCDFTRPPLKHKTTYKGKWNLLYEQAVAAWSWGKGQEARECYWEILHNYWDEVDDWHKSKITTFITSMGSGPPHLAIKKYNPENYEKFRYKFPGLESIRENYSQCYQDLFVLAINNGKKKGTYLEVGSGDATKCNNTYLLEKDFEWKGIGVEWDKKLCATHAAIRKNSVLNADALTLNYKDILDENFDTKIIDYLQLDVEPAPNTYQILTKIPFDDYKFRVITYEHDHYVDTSRQCRELSRNYLQSKGYKLLVSDIAPHDKCSFEDWWIHPDLVNSEISQAFESELSTVKRVDKFMLCEEEQKPVVIYSVAKSSQNSAWVLDDFYEHPLAVREFALKQDFVEGGFGRGFIGRRTEKQFLFDGIKEKFESLMNKKITKWEEHGMNGRFQVAWSGEPLVYHCDSQKWGGLIYLTPDAPHQCGTTLYAHKGTGARTYRQPGWDAAWRDIPGDPHLDGTPFEPVDVMGNVFNRLIIFDAACIHAASEYFGTTMENARLWQMFFFDT